MGRRRRPAPRISPAPVVTPPSTAPVPWREQVRRAAWMSLFPPAVGVASVVIATWGTRGRLGAALLWIVPAAAVFFVLLAGASLVGSRLRGPRFALQTRTRCPACSREIAVIQTRCPACEAAVPVSREAFPTFVYTAVAYAAFQLMLLAALRAR